MPFVFILLLFAVFRLIDFVVIFLAQKFIPYLGFFPYGDVLMKYHLPKIISALANFDGIHYLLIAKQGYSTYEQAFFPFYPLLVRAFSWLFFGNHMLTGVIISNLSFLLGLWIFSKYVKKAWPIILLLLFPTSFFFGAVYTEGLFFFLVVASLYFLKKEKCLWSAGFAFLASLTRLLGIFLIIPIGINLLIQKSKLKNQNHKLKFKKLILLAAPISGLVVYSLYLLKTTGDALFFFTSQPIFGANRSTKIILLPQVYFRYFKIFLTATHDFRFYIAAFEFLIFNLVLVILILDLIKNLKLKNKNYSLLGLGLFSLVNLVLPTLTGTFSSIPRYALLSLSFFIFLGNLKNACLKLAAVIIFLILHVLALAFFIQGYFVS